MRSILRDATTPDHRALDASLAPLLGKEAGYRAFLIGSGEALFPLEAALSQAGVEALLPDWPRRARSAALRKDLADLDAHETCLPIDLPAFSSPPSLYGALYVLEGSRLGAKALAQQALAHESPRVRSATRYLRHGTGEGFWPSFLLRLEGDAAAREGLEEAIASARATFAAFASTLARATGGIKIEREDG